MQTAMISSAPNVVTAAVCKLGHGDAAAAKTSPAVRAQGRAKNGTLTSRKSEMAPGKCRLIQEREARLAILDQALARGLADAEAGRVRPASDVFARLEAKYRASAPE